MNEFQIDKKTMSRKPESYFPVISQSKSLQSCPVSAKSTGGVPCYLCLFYSKLCDIVMAEEKSRIITPVITLTNILQSLLAMFFVTNCSPFSNKRWPWGFKSDNTFLFAEFFLISSFYYFSCFYTLASHDYSFRHYVVYLVWINTEQIFV